MNPCSRGPRQTMACSAPPGTIAQRILAKAPTLSPKNITPKREIAISKAFWGKSYRSEEHTSELQSLMRISYAVFCLQKQTIHVGHHHTIQLAIEHHTNTLGNQTHIERQSSTHHY